MACASCWGCCPTGAPSSRNVRWALRTNTCRIMCLSCTRCTAPTHCCCRRHLVAVRCIPRFGEALGQPLPHLLILLLLQVPVLATTLSGLSAVTANFSDVTPAVSQVVGNEGHPELREFVKQRTAGPVQLQMAFVPNAQGAGQHSVNFVISPGAKLLAHFCLSAVPALSSSQACYNSMGLECCRGVCCLQQPAVHTLIS